MTTPSQPPRRDGDGALEGGATVLWDGDLKTGHGTLCFSLGAGGELPLLWPGAAAYGPGATSPEELAAAAHAACFTMTLAHTLARQRHPPQQITTSAEASFGLVDGIRRIVRSQLEVMVQAEGVTAAELEHAANLAGHYCPVSNTLQAAGVELVVAARLTSP